MQPLGVGFDGRLFARFEDHAVDLVARLLDFLLDAGGMDAPVRHQFAQRHAGNLAANGVEAADDDGFGRIVHDEIDAHGLFDGADVAPLTTDDAPLHFVGGEIDAADGVFGDMLAGDALNRHGDDLAGTAVGLIRDLGFDFADGTGHFLAGVCLDSLQEDLLRFLLGHLGDLLQFGSPFFFHRRQLGGTLVELGFALGELALACFQLFQTALGAIQPVLEPLLAALLFFAPPGLLGLHFVAHLDLFFFDGQLLLLDAGVGFGQNALCLVLGGLEQGLLTGLFRLQIRPDGQVDKHSMRRPRQQSARSPA